MQYLRPRGELYRLCYLHDKYIITTIQVVICDLKTVVSNQNVALILSVMVRNIQNVGSSLHAGQKHKIGDVS